MSPPPNPILGFSLIIFHWALVGFILLYLAIGNVNNLFYGCTLIWILIVVLHFYFKGCFLTKLERELLETKDWYGIWFIPFEILKKNNIELTPNLKNNIYNCFGLLVSTIIIVRITLN